jgi:hypothetical protein
LIEVSYFSKKYLLKRRIKMPNKRMLEKAAANVLIKIETGILRDEDTYREMKQALEAHEDLNPPEQEEDKRE